VNLNTLIKGIQSQKIKGNTLEEKAEWFKGKKEEMDKKLIGDTDNANDIEELDKAYKEGFLDELKLILG